MTAPRHDRAFWTEKSNYLSSWVRRAKMAATLIPDQWVCDIGCGMEVLRSLLPRSTVYLPADLRQWNDGVELCDLDAGEMPERSLRLCDVCVMLGVMEHLEKPREALKRIAEDAEFLVVSYNRADLRLDQDRWKNALSESEFSEMISGAGYRIAAKAYYQRQVIVRAVNDAFDDRRRERRAAARAGFQPKRMSWQDEFRRAVHRFKALRLVGSDRSGRSRRRSGMADVPPAGEVRD